MCHLLTRYQSTIFPNHKSCVRKKGVPADTVIAIDWLKKAEAHGDKDAGRYWKQLYYDRSVMSIDRLLRLKPFNEYMVK